MSGLPDYNYPAFNEAARILREEGLEVANPAETPPQDTWQDYMRHAIRKMMLCDEVILLPGWHKSRGACIEKRLAAELGIPWREWR